MPVIGVCHPFSILRLIVDGLYHHFAYHLVGDVIRHFSAHQYPYVWMPSRTPVREIPGLADVEDASGVYRRYQIYRFEPPRISPRPSWTSDIYRRFAHQ